MNKQATGLLTASALILLSPLTGCIDNNYDLSDIDTTVKVSVNSLTLPVNIDEIFLSSIIDTEEGDKIQIIDNQYAILEDGTFGSDPINIEQFSITAPEISPSITEIQIPSVTGVRNTGDISFNIDLAPISGYSYNYSGISTDIVDMEQLEVSWGLTYSINLEATDGTIPSGIKLQNIRFQLPKGLTGTPSIGTYNPETGEISISEIDNIQNGVSLTMTASAINLAKAGAIFNYNDHSIDIHGETGLTNADMLIPAASIAGIQVPSKLYLSIHTQLGDFEVKSFTGSIKHTIDGLNISPITLNDLPDFLNQEGTNISLANPQIYINISNPFSNYNIHGSAGFSLTALRNDGSLPVSCTIDNSRFELRPEASSSYCLSPSIPGTYYPGFENIQHVPFTSLSGILSGNGLPNEIQIEIPQPEIPTQHVTGFRLGSYPAIEGRYTFFAPLALGKGSVITYSDTEDGWNDEDIDQITINELQISATVSTNLPFGVQLTGYPVDVDGQQINNVEITGADIAANANGTQVKIHITGTVTHLDGIRFEARATAPETSQPLSPSQGITLKNIRATVSGYYEKEL
ncbi:hypothetical protein [uncultured Muribaculum sp.]|uniref:hypothetical protein n=1 Tax=uncultured Muribaculum sp. TaxID=1918613 RepID=UPI0025B76845|nr:hypothetical protein [uncultured Muribaculum sp.]